jgi:initiation factor 1A
MVKNSFGGNKAKRGARKNTNVDSVSRQLRLIEEDGECYAIITKILGGGMCESSCYDGKQRLCVIPGKFKGRGRSSNRVEVGKWVMVGIRDWEVRSNGSQKCDLMHVYSDGEKEKLLSKSDINFAHLIAVMKTTGDKSSASIAGGAEDDEGGIIFSNTIETKYDDMSLLDNNTGLNVVLVQEKEINIDDI